MIGEYSYSNSPIPDEVEVGRYCQIAEGVKFLSHDEHPSVLDREVVASYPIHEKLGVTSYPPCGSKGPIIIGNDVLIGTNAIILSGVTIGDGSIIGAGAIVTKNIPPFSVVVGNPGKVIRKRFPQATITKLLKIGWWNWNRLKVADKSEDFKKIDRFINKNG